MANPEYDKLKACKKEHNKKLRELISEVINFKRAFNGQAVTGYGVEKYKLSESPPENLFKKLDSLTERFMRISEESNKILDFQKSVASDIEQKKSNK